MTTAGPEMGQLVREELSRRGIAFHPERKAVRFDAGARRIVFEDGSDAACDLLIAIPPHEAPKVVRDAGLVGPSGWIPADPRTLRVVGAAGAAETYAIGTLPRCPCRAASVRTRRSRFRRREFSPKRRESRGAPDRVPGAGDRDG